MSARTEQMVGHGHPAIEIAVQDVAGARIAREEGASRVELCMALGVGGLTPSLGLIEGAAGEAAAANRNDFAHVLIRPRPGGFVYDTDEIETCVRDIRAARAAGAAGVVVGSLTDARTIHTESLRAFVDAAQGVQVTFHRAFDVVPDVREALDVLAELGVTRVLTSGQAAASIDGKETLAMLVRHAAGAVEIMAGGGVTIESIAPLCGIGVDAVHLSAKTAAEATAPSGPGGGVSDYEVTSRSLVRAAVAAVAAVADRWQ